MRYAIVLIIVGILLLIFGIVSKKMGESIAGGLEVSSSENVIHRESQPLEDFGYDRKGKVIRAKPEITGEEDEVQIEAEM